MEQTPEKKTQEPTAKYDVADHNREVGLVCTQWAYLEWLLEVAIWWFRGLLAEGTPDSERDAATADMPVSSLADQACNLATSKLTETDELAAMDGIRRRIKAVVDERNLAVHGVRSLLPDETVVARVTRGKYKGTLQRLPMIRLRSLNAEIARIIAVFEPLLYKHGVIEGITAITEHEQKAHQGYPT